jgi:hypothetical protein
MNSANDGDFDTGANRLRRGPAHAVSLPRIDCLVADQPGKYALPALPGANVRDLAAQLGEIVGNYGNLCQAAQTWLDRGWRADLILFCRERKWS